MSVRFYRTNKGMGNLKILSHQVFKYLLVLGKKYERRILSLNCVTYYNPQYFVTFDVT